VHVLLCWHDLDRVARPDHDPDSLRTVGTSNVLGAGFGSRTCTFCQRSGKFTATISGDTARQRACTSGHATWCSALSLRAMPRTRRRQANEASAVTARDIRRILRTDKHGKRIVPRARSRCGFGASMEPATRGQRDRIAQFSRLNHGDRP
jgi:hypothetical protein